MPGLAWIILLAAAVLEVAGDALVRRGMRTGGVVAGAAGFVALGCYGVVVNAVRWDFARLFGLYVAVFATVAILAGRLVFRETVAPATWVGLGLIVAGGLVIQFGRPR